MLSSTIYSNGLNEAMSPPVPYHTGLSTYRGRNHTHWLAVAARHHIFAAQSAKS